MQNIIFGYGNRVDGATVSGGSWSATLPITNLQSRLISKIARTTNAQTASTLINVDLGASPAYAIGCVGLVAHNISSSGTVRVRGSSDSGFATSTYDSGWLSVWPSGVIPPALLEWENTNFWLGTLSEQARAGFKSPYITYNSARTIARYWRIEISDTTNSDGYVQIGRLFMSDVFQPTYNYGWLSSLGYADPTTISRSLGGEEYFDQASRYRTFKAKLEWLTATEAHASWLEMQRLVGTSGEVLVIPDLDDATTGIYRNFVGRFVSLSPIVQLPSRRYSCELEMRELL